MQVEGYKLGAEIGTFDAVFLNNMIDKVEDPETLLREIVGFLK
jgi:2-polyprenyl-3-methyl-5-hydroxy-6-metoxy-1,4-benzoquinol methylase